MKGEWTIAEVISRTVRQGDEEMLLLPPEVAFGEGVQLTLVRSGDVLTAYPARKGDIKALLAALKDLPAPSYVEERDVELLPERPGL